MYPNDFSTDFVIDITNYNLWPVYSDPHSHDYYELYFLFHGSINYTIENNVYQVSEGDIVWIPPNIPHFTRPHNTERHKRMLFYIKSPIIEEYLQKNPDSENFISSTQVFHPSEKEKRYFRNLSNILLEEYYSEQSYSQQMCRGILINILFLVQRMYEKTLSQKLNTNSAMADPSVDLKVLLSFIRIHFRDDISLTSLSKQVNLNPAYISSLFKKHFGFTFKKYLIDLRLKAAMEMLKTTEKSIEAIAFDCGFNSSNHFCKTFKSNVGMPPKMYRNIGNK